MFYLNGNTGFHMNITVSSHPYIHTHTHTHTSDHIQKYFSTHRFGAKEQIYIYFWKQGWFKFVGVDPERYS